MQAINTTTLTAFLCACLSFCAIDSAQAEVTAKAAGGFQIVIEVDVELSQQEAYELLTEGVSQWWLPDHTYTGDSDNLYIACQEKGWFGERLADGGLCCHLQVCYFEPGSSIRFLGGLGPLQPMGVHGAMVWSLSAADEEGMTHLTVTYNVSGYSPQGLDALATIVDGVLQQQFDSFAAVAAESIPRSH